MHFAFFNPQGNFDPDDSYWTEHPDFGGQLVYVKEVALALGAMGNRVDIVTRQIFDPDWPEFSQPQDRYPAGENPGAENVRILRLPCGPKHFLPKEQLWPYLGTEWVPNIIAFYTQEDQFPAAITTHYGDGGLAGAFFARHTGIPFTFTAHSLGAQKMDKLGAHPDNLAEIDARFNFRYRIAAERTAMNHAGRIITSTQQERYEQYSHPAYRGAVDPQDNEKFAVIPPGVNLRIFSTRPASQDARVRARIQAALQRDIDPDRQQLPVVVCASRLDPKKNHIGLVQAFARNHELRGCANLAIVVRGVEHPFQEYHNFNPGEAAVFQEIVTLIEKSGLRGKVTAFPLNSQQELAAGYRVLVEYGSVFALTALYEPFGLAPLEAMSCGLPVVVTRNGGPSESLYEDGREYGVLVDPSDAEAIAGGILRLLRSPETWRKFQIAGLARIQSKYTWQRTAEGYQNVLRTLAKRPFRSGTIAVPEFFTHPERPISLESLYRTYFEQESV